jgi:hypothetical protein
MVSALPINTGNTVDVRRLMDERVFDVLEECGYRENTFWGNVKMVIMALACGVALFAQFNPWEFPENRWVLGACCACYAALSVVLQYVVTTVDQDYIMFCHPKDDDLAAAKEGKQDDKASGDSASASGGKARSSGSDGAGAAQRAVCTGVGVRADMQPFDHHYRLVIESLHAGKGSGSSSNNNNNNSRDGEPFARVELPADKTSIGKYFDTNGYFYEEDFEKEVRQLLAEFEAKFKAAHTAAKTHTTKAAQETKKEQ